MSKLRLWCVTAGVMVAAIGVSATAAQSAEDAIEVGDMVPDFELPGSDGKSHQLSDYRGKTVVIAWYPRAFTGG